MNQKAKLIIKLTFYFSIFFIIWINIPLLFPKLVNNKIFSLGYFHEIPEEYKFLQLDKDNFKIIDLDFINDDSIEFHKSEVFKYFYKKDRLNQTQINLIFGEEPINIDSLLDKNSLKKAGLICVKYILLHHIDNNDQEYFQKLDDEFEVFNFKNAGILKNKYYKEPEPITPIPDLLIFKGKSDELENRLKESINLSNFGLITENENNKYSEIINILNAKDYIIPLNLNKAVGKGFANDYSIYFELADNNFPKDIEPEQKIDINWYVYNIGNKTWYPDKENPINISYHIYDAETDEVVVFDGIRTNIDKPIIPGDKFKITMKVFLPNKEGKYYLEPFAVKEYMFWFSNKENSPNGNIQIFFTVSNQKESNFYIKYLENLFKTNPILKYQIDIPKGGSYYLLIGNQGKYNNSTLNLLVNNNKFEFSVNENHKSPIFPGYKLIGKINFNEGENNIEFENLNFLKDKNNIRNTDYLYFISSNNLNNHSQYQIKEIKLKNSFVRFLSIKTLGELMLTTNQDKNIEIRVILENSELNKIYIFPNNNSKILFFSYPGTYNIAFREGHRIIQFANTYHEYAYYEQYED